MVWVKVVIKWCWHLWDEGLRRDFLFIFSCCSQAEEQSPSTGDRMQEDKTHLAAPTGSSGTARRTWWDTDDHMEQTKCRPDSAPPHWRFSSIHFPDLGSTETPFLTSPDPSLLPGPFPVGRCNIAPWRQKINLRKVKMSAKDQERDKDKHRHQRDINKDRDVSRMPEICDIIVRFVRPFYVFGVFLKVQQCRNWAEYRELLVRRGRRPTRRHECLWNREVTPLHDPWHPIPTGEITHFNSGGSSSFWWLSSSIFASGAVGKDPCDPVYTFAGGGVQVTQIWWFI